MADIEEARKQFERIDTNGDGFITAAEFKTALAQGGDKLLSFDEFWIHLNK
ncbi:EF-hand domain-containing protein [Streptomyces cellulosae]